MKNNFEPSSFIYTIDRCLILLLFLIVLNCSDKNITSSISIEGKSTKLIGKTIYLKTNNHFDFLNENFELDSTIVDAYGKFKFQIDIEEPLLVKIDKYDDNLTGTLKVFKETPQDYQYLLCKNFLASDPTIYLEPGENYSISFWGDEYELNGVLHDDSNHNLIRQYYHDSEYYDAVRFNRKIKEISADLAWEELKKTRTRLLKKYKVDDEQPINSFNHHLRTEIILGASNWFFNWFDAREMTDFKSKTYTEALDVYHLEEWNKMSLHYFKLSERLVNTKLSYKYDLYKPYHNPSYDKLAIAKEIIGLNVREQYISNIEKLLE